MKRILLIIFAALAAATPAQAATVNVRIEGQNATLFEGPVATNGRNVQSLSERTTGAIRRCDGTNNSGSGAIVPTGTAATADALAISGQGFDGQWFDEYEDYLITRLGNENAGWRLFKNRAFSVVGGCQMKLTPDQEVMWASQGGNALGLTLTGATVTTVAGAEILKASAGGAQGPALGTTGPDGTFTVTGLGAGWHRIKARKDGSVRSNRVNLCVNPCGDLPSDMQLRTPPPPVFYGPGGRTIPNSPELSRTVSPLRVTRPVAGATGYRRGRIDVRWRIADQGVGLLRWTIASDDLTSRAKTYVVRERGTSGTSASLRLPAGRVHALRFTSTDRLQREDAVNFGRVIVPVDDRARSVKRSGSWRKVRSSKAWEGTVLRGRRGAQVKVRLAAGRPALLTRGRRAAKVRIGSRLVSVRSGRRTVLGPKRRKAGSVTITVVRGSIDLDGLAASP